AASSHMVYGFFNSSTPTVTALSCSYCSYLPATNPHTWWLPENNHGKTRLRCLPHILRDQGYHTTHAHTMENKFGGAGEVLIGIGFQEVLGQKALENVLREPAMHWGYSDHQLHRFLVRRLRDGKHKAPFLLSAATVDSHAPFVSDADSVPYGDGKNELLNSIYTADHAFGLFWNYLKGSPYFHNTIVIVLADHAMFPGKEHADVRGGEDITGRYYDRILCGIYNPMYLMKGRSNVVSGQIDLTPTILHMLGLNVRNHFEGHSIFEGRKLFPELVGMHEYLFWIFQKVDGKPTMTNFQLADMKGRGVGFDATSPVLTQAEYYHYYQWKKALHVNNRIWK
ncbi:MAG: sulfatase-like hydrolase/transferase, partial [Planctomycetota bacterium]